MGRREQPIGKARQEKWSSTGEGSEPILRQKREKGTGLSRFKREEGKGKEEKKESLNRPIRQEEG